MTTTVNLRVQMQFYFGYIMKPPKQYKGINWGIEGELERKTTTTKCRELQHNKILKNTLVKKTPIIKTCTEEINSHEATTLRTSRFYI